MLGDRAVTGQALLRRILGLLTRSKFQAYSVYTYLTEACSKIELNQAKHLLRVATEFTQLLYHVDKARLCAFSKEIQWVRHFLSPINLFQIIDRIQRVDRIKATLLSDLDHLFTTVLLQFSQFKGGLVRTDAEKIKRMADLTDCLRVYDMLGTWRDAEEVVRKEVVRAFVKKVCSKN